MNPKYHADSKDFFKRGFLDLLKNCKSIRTIKILPLFTGEYGDEDVGAYASILGVNINVLISIDPFYRWQNRKEYIAKAAFVAATADIFLDPDRGVVKELRNQHDDREVVSCGEIRDILDNSDSIVIAFDESLDNADRETKIGEKIDTLATMDVSAFAYFNSSPNQPCLLFAAKKEARVRVQAVRDELIKLGIPKQKTRPLLMPIKAEVALAPTATSIA